MSLSAKEARELSSKNTERQEKIKQYIEWQENSIRRACDNGHRRTCFAYGYDMPEVVKHFKDLGYTFKPTGYSGGVWQNSTDICG